MQAALRGLRQAGARAAEAAFAVTRAGTIQPGPLAASQMQALASGPDMAKGLADLIQARLAYRANAAVLRGADAAAAALLRRSV